jgi:hypothetical protein
MRNAESTADICLLTDAELEDVSGGNLIAYAVMIGTFCVMAGNAWDLPLGATKADAAAALGVSYLFN